MQTFPLNYHLQLADSILSPLAVKHSCGFGRAIAEQVDPDRTRFRIDADRINFYSNALEALKGKQQVFRSGTATHVQTRYTHSFRVARMTASVCKIFGLNSELGYAIGLAHDLGHTPFGHAGQDALHACMSKYNKTFEHNIQAYRILTEIEPLNTSIELHEGLLKHLKPGQNSAGPMLKRGHSLEAQIANKIDAIVYTEHDVKDGIHMNILTIDMLKQTALGNIAAKHPRDIPRGMVEYMINDIKLQLPKGIDKYKLKNLTDVYNCTEPVLTLSSTMETLFAEFDTFMNVHLYQHPIVCNQSTEGAKAIELIFAHLIKTPNTSVQQLEHRLECNREDAVRDYIVSLTDNEALTLAQSL